MTHDTAVRPEADRGLADRAIAWLPYVLFAGLLAAVLRSIAVRVSNGDTFFHLRFGHEFLNGWSPWAPGHVSTFGQRDWVPTQWLSQVAMAAAESVFGLPGVVWLLGTAVLVLVVAVLLVARAYADPLPAVVVTIVAVLGTLVNLTSRPQVVSYLLILVTTHVWLRTASDLRVRWWLVPLGWLWAMLHGLWIVGPVIGLVATLGIALDHRDRWHELRPALLRMVSVSLLSGLVAGLTPVGPRLFAQVVLVGGRAKFHDEWAATDFHVPQAATVAGMVAVVLLVWLMGRGARPGWTPVLLLLLAAAWSAYAQRTVPVATMMLVPLLAAALQSLLRREPEPRERDRRWILGLGGAAVVVLAVLVPFTSDRPADSPGWVDSALGDLPAGTAVQTSSKLGGYLMWRYPDLDFTIDGYTDTYTTKHLEDQLKIDTVRPKWDRLLEDSGVRYAFLPTRGSLAYALVHDQGWRTLHTSEDVVLLEAPAGWGS